MPVIAVHYEGSVPAKSNRYRIVYHGKHPGLRVADEVAAFEEELTQLFREAIPREVQWAVPKGRKRLKVVDPLFPRGTPVRVEASVFGPNNKGCDLDNALKAILDAATKAGVWADDNKLNVSAIWLTHVEAEQPGLEVKIYDLVDEEAQPCPLP